MMALASLTKPDLTNVPAWQATRGSAVKIVSMPLERELGRPWGWRVVCCFLVYRMVCLGWHVMWTIPSSGSRGGAASDSGYLEPPRSSR